MSKKRTAKNAKRDSRKPGSPEALAKSLLRRVRPYDNPKRQTK